MGQTQAHEQQSFAQARGAYDPDYLRAHDPEGSKTTQLLVSSIAQAAELYFLSELQVISNSWTPAKYRAWALCDFRPSSASGTGTSCRIAWFSPSGKISDATQLWHAVSVWTEVEVALRGPHMQGIVEAHRALTVIDIKRHGRLGWPSILHLLEARAMRLRSSPPQAIAREDTPKARVKYAFTIRADDRDVKATCDVPIPGPIQVRVRDDHRSDRNRDDRNEREQRPAKRAHSGPAPGTGWGFVPMRYMTMENLCFEWMAAGQPEISQNHPCPSNAGHQCPWEHFVDPATPQSDIVGFTEWCRRRPQPQQPNQQGGYARRGNGNRRRWRGRP